MATRCFCDHCGNTVRNPNKLMYGSYNYVLDPGHQHQLPQLQQLQQMQAIQAANQRNAGGAACGTVSTAGLLSPYTPQGQHPISPQQYYPAIVIDLCDTCAPIWLDRVRKLTESSNPD